MPHACRALGQDAEKPPDTAASVVFAEVVGRLVDHLVRTAAEPPWKGTSRFASLHDQWAHALRSPDGRMKGETAELAQLAEQVRTWRRPIEIAASAPFRLCFRLEEPRAETGKAAGRWRVNYLLQAVDDLSLLVPAEDAWKARGKEAAVLGRDGFRPREYLLAALGQAATLSPPIEASLKAAAPAGYDLDTAGAHEFLSRHAGPLEQAGFGVFLPAWWTRKGTRLRLSARAVVVVAEDDQQGRAVARRRSSSSAGRSRSATRTLTLEELKALAKLKTPLVKVRGQWVEISAEEIRAALAFWDTEGRDVDHGAGGRADGAGRRRSRPARSPSRACRRRAGSATCSASSKGPRGSSCSTLPTASTARCGPTSSAAIPGSASSADGASAPAWPTTWGWARPIQTLALIQREWEASPARKRRPTLLICPMSVVGNWHKEAARFTPDLPVMVHHGLERARGAAFAKQAAKHALVLSSYSLLHRDFDLFRQVTWSNLVLDEAQNIKNPQTKQAQAARALKAGHRIALTGTPVENHVGDLWSIIEFLNPGWLGTQAEFKRTFHIPIQAEHDPGAARRLKRLTAPFILRRLKTDKAIIADLPEKLEMKVFCTLTKEQASLYTAVLADTAEQIESSEGIQRKGLVLATLVKLKQVCNHPAQFLHDNSAVAGRSGKLARLTEMLEEVLSAGDRALVFTQFAEMGEMLEEPPPGGVRPRGAVPPRRDAQVAPRPDGRAVPGQGRRRAAGLHPVAQGGRHRA